MEAAGEERTREEGILTASPLARFVAVHDAPESDRFGAVPLYFAVMLAVAPGGAVLVFNLYRQVWELPGGLIDPGEAPRDAAIRELREEAGCEARDTRWLGVVEVHDSRAWFGAVYRCEVDAVPEKIPDAEIGDVAVVPAGQAPHDLGMSDAALLQRFWSVQ